NVLMDSKKVIIVITLIITCIGGTVALLSTPIYRADSLLQIRENTQSISNQLDSITNFFETKTPVQAEIELIKSRTILGKAIKNLHLDIIAAPRFFPIIGKATAKWWQQLNGNNLLPPPLFGLSN